MRNSLKIVLSLFVILVPLHAVHAGHLPLVGDPWSILPGSSTDSSSSDNSGDGQSDDSSSTEGGSSSDGSTGDDSSTDSGSSQAPVKAMWVWGSNSVLDSSRQSQLLSFAQEKNVNLLYVGAWSALVKHPETLADFIRKCLSRGIDVELLFGEREWAFYENHQKVLNIADQVVDFARRYPDARPTAMHLDVEPYSLQAWKDDKESVANQMVDLYEAVHQRLEGSGLSLVVDIPIWFDRHEITRNGKLRVLHELVIEATDGVALMDYRDTYDRIVSDAVNELQYASQLNKTVVVGVETLCIEPETITFCEEGSEYMEDVLQRLDGEMPSQYPSYRGHAVHHFDSYRDLQP